MATTCRIGILKENKVESIYCHYDGYLAGVGVILKDNYKTKEKGRRTHCAWGHR